MSNYQQTALWHIPTATEQDKQSAKLLTNLLKQNLQDIYQRFNAVTLASSLAAEDMVLTHVIASLHLPVDIFILNTGKLHQTTLTYLETVQKLYPSVNFVIHEPQENLLQEFKSEYDLSDIYQSTTARKACCYTRKIEPLSRALAPYQAWITGQRRTQSSTRQDLQYEEWDNNNLKIKFNPLANWDETDIWAFIQSHGIPVNSLYHHGYPSIGCEPCTKAIRQGESIRAGRWWWENQDNKECGLHTR